MSFKNAVQATSGLGGAFKSGLQALEASDRARISVSETTRLCGSVNLDVALRTGAGANQHIWDYGVCHTSGTQGVHWIEVHPASDHGVSDLRAKFAWLKAWLSGEGHRLKPLTVAFIWISSGKTTFTKTSPAARKLAAEGVIAVGSHYSIR